MRKFLGKNLGIMVAIILLLVVVIFVKSKSGKEKSGDALNVVTNDPKTPTTEE